MKKIIRRVAALVIGLGLGASALAGLETVTHISDLNASWPLGSDLASTSDDHIRNIKTALKNDFPNINGAVTATPTQLNTTANLTASGSNLTASANLTANAFIPNSSTVPTNGIYLPSANTLGFSSNTTARGSIGSAGAWTINAPSSGTALTITGDGTSAPLTLQSVGAGQVAVYNSTAVNGVFATYDVSGSPVLDIGSRKQVTGSGAATDGSIDVRGANAFALATNSVERYTVSSSGAFVINAPTSGIAFTATGDGSSAPISIQAAAAAQVGVFNTTNVNGIFATFDVSGTAILDIGSRKQATGAGSASDGGIAVRGNNSFAIATNSTERFLITGAGALSGYGSTAAGLVDMTPDTGTFTATYTGFTAGVTCTATWSRIGKLVSLFFCAATGTSNATSFTMTGLPSAIQPGSLTQTVPLPIGPVQNASIIDTTVSATVTSASGTVTFLHNGSSSGWTNSGTKGFSSGATISYLLN